MNNSNDNIVTFVEGSTYEAEPAQEMNFTVRDKLFAFGYIKIESRPSPYKSHKKGRMVDFAVITKEGLNALALTL